MGRELTIRESESGGRIKNSVEPHNAILNDRNPIVFMVHGFNEDVIEARENYDIF